VFVSTSTTNQWNIDDNRELRLSSTTNMTCAIHGLLHFMAKSVSRPLDMATSSTRVLFHYHSTATRKTRKTAFVKTTFWHVLVLDDIDCVVSCLNITNSLNNKPQTPFLLYRRPTLPWMVHPLHLHACMHARAIFTTALAFFMNYCIDLVSILHLTIHCIDSRYIYISDVSTVTLSDSLSYTCSWHSNARSMK
jgi:hypothetical protein